MYKALYGFDGQGQGTLRFQPKDEFNLIEQVDNHWWLMQSSSGETGLVPASYLEINKVVKSEVLESIDRAIDVIHTKAARRGGPLTTDERKNLQKLISHRHSVSSGQITDAQKALHEIPQQPKRPAPTPPERRSTRPQSVKMRRAPQPPKQSSVDTPSLQLNEPQLDTNKNATTASPVEKEIIRLPEMPVNHVASPTEKRNFSDIELPSSLGTHLVDSLKSRLKLNQNQGITGVKCLCEGMGAALPQLKTIFDKIIETIPTEDDSLEGLELRRILENLTECKDDSQQRMWAVHEDFSIIHQMLTDLLIKLDKSSRTTCVKILEEDDYRYLHNLVVYYQMETRTKLRILLLQVFGCCCEFGRAFVTQLLCSILPTELASNLMTDMSEIFKTLSTSLLLTMIFSTGEPVPFHHYAQLNEAFVDHLLDSVEDPPSSDEDDQIPDSFIALILSFNQHFKDSSQNPVMKVLASGRILRTFSEKIMLLINREEDPAAMFSYHKPFPNSVLKILQDMFSNKETSGIFFTNDLMVLIDIILRQLTDLADGDKVRTEYLCLFHDLVANTDYAEHCHRRKEFNDCFNKIVEDEENDVESDKYIIRKIGENFPQLFVIPR